RFWDGEVRSRILRVRFNNNRVAVVRNVRDGSELPLVRLDPAHIANIYPAQREDRILVRLEQVPQPLVEALIAIEDRRFLQHHGISLVGIGRAIVADIRAGAWVQGGSTLTQQLVKNYFLSNERTLWRKFNEAIMAILLEVHYSKREILQAYLNEVYLGQDGARAIHGFGLASRFYFDKPLDQLRLEEQALLVGLVRGPSYYNPRKYPERARARRNRVLDAMLEQGFASREAVQRAKRRGLGVVPRPPSGDTAYPAFMDLVQRHLRRDYRHEDLTSEGLLIFTTLAPSVQHAAEQALADRAEQWLPGTEGAVVVVSVDSGEVQALVGGTDPRYKGFNRALDAHRQVGSLIKPAIYLAALSRPQRFGLGSLLRDKPVTLEFANGQSWTPRNYDRERHGVVPLWSALAHSYNVPTVRLGMKVGLRAVVDTIQRLGGPVPDTVYPSVLLGAIQFTPLDVTKMYETIASGGFRIPLRAVRAVVTPDYEVLSHYPLQISRAFDPGPIYLLQYGLRQVVEQGTARGLSRWLPQELKLAGKTGTTDDTRDSWFAAFTGERLGVVWVGRDDGGRTGLTGSGGAMTVWGQMMGKLQPLQSLELDPPESVQKVWVEAQTGALAAAYCEHAVRLPYISGTAPDGTSQCIRPASEIDRAMNWVRGLFN
ncbi:MAG: penicillin-binding protein 1B, partial [Nitrococcus sp.]|nr:penicillin-binding protein 1B [Nitrococcus sp.]